MESTATDAIEQWLLSRQAQPWLAEAAADERAPHQTVAYLRRHLTAEQARRVSQLAELRRRALSKFPAGGQMFFTRVGLEQATDHWIAAYKSKRWRDYGAIADLCCGVGGDAIALARVVRELTLCDRSPTMTRLASRNVEVAACGSRARVKCLADDVSAVDLAKLDAWHIDPDRRPAGRRTTQAELHEPSGEVIDRLLAVNPNAALKLAPACPVPARWRAAGELEWIGRDGECKQQVAWLGSLAERPGTRRATLLLAKGSDVQVTRTLTAADDSPAPARGEAGRYVFEPHAAVLAADMGGALAREHGWWTFASTAGYLSGDTLPMEPAAAAFEVEDILALNVKKLSKYLRDRRIGLLEIKHRGVPIQPELLRRELKLSGEAAATMLVTRVGEKRIAIIARRLPAIGSR